MELKIKFIPYETLKTKKLDSLVKNLKDDMILLIDAKLTPKEEAELIQATMSAVSEKFKGIELTSLDIGPLTKTDTFQKLKNQVFEIILGRKRGLTVIGPANIIKRIEKNPKELLFYIS